MNNTDRMAMGSALRQLEKWMIIAGWYEEMGGKHGNDGLWQVEVAVRLVSGIARFRIQKYRYYQREGIDDGSLVEVFPDTSAVQDEFRKMIQSCIE